VTEGHDELVEADKSWRIEYVAREGGSIGCWPRSRAPRGKLFPREKHSRTPLRESFLQPDFLRRFPHPPSRWCSMSLCGNRHKVAAFAAGKVPVGVAPEPLFYVPRLLLFAHGS